MINFLLFSKIFFSLLIQLLYQSSLWWPESTAVFSSVLAPCHCWNMCYHSLSSEMYRSLDLGKCILWVLHIFCQVFYATSWDIGTDLILILSFPAHSLPVLSFAKSLACFRHRFFHLLCLFAVSLASCLLCFGLRHIYFVLVLMCFQHFVLWKCFQIALILQ